MSSAVACDSEMYNTSRSRNVDTRLCLASTSLSRRRIVRFMHVRCVSRYCASRTFFWGLLPIVAFRAEIVSCCLWCVWFLVVVVVVTCYKEQKNVSTNRAEKRLQQTQNVRSVYRERFAAAVSRRE